MLNSEIVSVCCNDCTKCEYICGEERLTVKLGGTFNSGFRRVYKIAKSDY
jgi:hypothetical protein